MRIVGLTGGIGSGKSTVTKYLLNKGFSIIDADKIAREIVKPNSQLLRDLVACFGESIIMSDGNLDRKKLAGIVFSDSNQKLKLDEIMLKEIVSEILTQIEEYKKQDKDIIFIDAPLLFEVGLHKKCDETWVVDADDEIRIQRVIQRDELTRDDVIARINNQMSRTEKNNLASIILDNSTTHENLYEQIERLLK